MSTANDPNAWMAQKVFEKLSGMGHKIYMYDSKGSRVYDPSKADRLFSETAKMMVTLGFTKGKPAKPLVTFNTSDGTDPKVLLDVKQTLKQHNLYDHSFDTRPYGRTLEPKMFAHLNREDITESSWTGSTRTSRWKTGLTEVVIRHSERLGDPQSARRWCKIKDIFIHGPDGARYRMPIKHIAGAKALAQHINNNGQAWDDKGEIIHHMIKVMQESRKLRNWAQNQNSHLLSVIEGLQNKIKHNLKRMSDPNQYEIAIQEGVDWVNSWKTHEQMHETQCDEHIQNAWHAVMCELERDSQSQWPEEHELMEWFNQFKPLQELDSNDVINAVEVTASDDPRDILGHLKQEITGWEQEFELNPKQVLDKITLTVNKIKKS